MTTTVIEEIDVSKLSEEERNALAILANLPLADVNQLKATLKLSDPGVVGPTTLSDFRKLCTSSPVSLDLTNAGVNAFKDSHGLGNAGPLRGVIGPQTAAVYFNTIEHAMQNAGTSGVRAINQAGLDLVKEFEGYERLIHGTMNVMTYLDPVGVPTIGYGHTGSDVTPGLVITQSQAETLLRNDLSSAAKGVAGLVTIPLNDNQFAALVSFAFNVGVGTLANSTLLRLLNENRPAEAADQFSRFKFAAGQVLPGLVSRRAAERALFLLA